VVTENDLSKARSREGWPLPDYGTAELLIAPNRYHREMIERVASSEGCCNVFSGFGAYPKTYRTMKKLRRSSSIICVMAERPNLKNFFKAAAKVILYRFKAVVWRNRIHAVFVSGRAAEEWYCESGFSSSVIVPFGYFLNPSPSPSATASGLLSDFFDDKKKNIVFVGRVDSNKDLRILVSALSELREIDWRLFVVGDGPEKNAIEEQSTRYGISDDITWFGYLPNSEACSIVSRADLLVLPSQYDGWGAVINESLMLGTPVLVSDACGASDLVCKGKNGLIFKSGSVSSLLSSLGEILSGETALDSRAKIIDWAYESISPEIVSKYFLKVIEAGSNRGEFPSPPWRINYGKG